ncbi:hypothetical protein BJX96DRAFT_81560 [Aspergillus floccosus]
MRSSHGASASRREGDGRSAICWLPAGCYLLGPRMGTSQVVVSATARHPANAASMHAAEHHGDPQGSWSSVMSHPCYRRRRPWGSDVEGIPVYACGHKLPGRLPSTVQKARETNHPLPSTSVPRGDGFWRVAIGVVGSSPQCSVQRGTATRWKVVQGSTLRQTRQPGLGMAYALRYQMIWRARHKQQDLQTLSQKEQTRPSHCFRTLHKRRDTPLRMVGAQTPGEGLTAPTQSFHLKDGGKFPGRYRCGLCQSALRKGGSNMARGVDQGEARAARARARYPLGRSVADNASRCRRGGRGCSQTHEVSRGRRMTDLTNLREILSTLRCPLVPSPLYLGHRLSPKSTSLAQTTGAVAIGTSRPLDTDREGEILDLIVCLSRK